MNTGIPDGSPPDMATVAEQLNDLIDDLGKVLPPPPHASPCRACRSAVAQHTKTGA